MSEYKIISFNEATGQIIVDYAINMSPLVIDVPIVNGLFLSGDDLNTYIAGFIPTEFIERQNQLKNGIANSDEIKGLVTEQVNNDNQVVDNADDLRIQFEQQLKEKIEDVLIQYSLITEAQRIQ